MIDFSDPFRWGAFFLEPQNSRKHRVDKQTKKHKKLLVGHKFNSYAHGVTWGNHPSGRTFIFRQYLLGPHKYMYNDRRDPPWRMPYQPNGKVVWSTWTCWMREFVGSSPATMSCVMRDAPREIVETFLHTPRKTKMTGWKIHYEWRCISYCKWENFQCHVSELRGVNRWRSVWLMEPCSSMGATYKPMNIGKQLGNWTKKTPSGWSLMYARRLNSRPFDRLNLERVTESSQRRAQRIARLLFLRFSCQLPIFFESNMMIGLTLAAFQAISCQNQILQSIFFREKQDPVSDPFSRYFLVGWLGSGCTRTPHNSSVSVGDCDDKKGEGSRFGRVQNHGSADGASVFRRWWGIFHSTFSTGEMFFPTANSGGSLVGFKFENGNLKVEVCIPDAPWDWNIFLHLSLIYNQVVVSIIVYFHPFLGKWSNLTNISQLGWNHQPDNECRSRHFDI